MNTHFALLVGLALTACATDDPPPEPGPSSDGRLSVASLPLDVRMRLVRAAVYDVTVAEWIGDTLRHNTCGRVDAANGDLTLTGPCSTAAGSTFEGKLIVRNAFAEFPSYRFEGVRITSEPGIDTVLVDGVLDSEYDPATFRLTRHGDLVMTRSGIEVHTSITVTDGVVAAGSFVEHGGKRAELSGNLYTGIELNGKDQYSYQRDGACGMDNLQQQICVRTKTPNRFTRGSFRQLSLSCTNGDPEVRFETTSSSPLRASIAGGSYTVGSGTRDPASGNYVFTSRGGSCVTPFDYSVRQESAFRAELLVLPRVTWGR